MKTNEAMRRARDVIRRQHKTLSTEQTYLHWLRHYMVKEARRRIGVMVLPHELRHAYATHCLERGTNIKALQSAMGHVDVNTTLGYCHAEALSVVSPLETVTFP